MRPHVPAFRAAGAEVYIVGSGGSYFAKVFQEDLDIRDVTIYCDEELRAYRLAGFRRDLAGVVNVKSLGAAVRALRGGFRQKSTMGDKLQLGGVMIVLPSGKVAWSYLSRAAGDHAPPATVLSALEAARAA